MASIFEQLNPLSGNSVGLPSSFDALSLENLASLGGLGDAISTGGATSNPITLAQILPIIQGLLPLLGAGGGQVPSGIINPSDFGKLFGGATNYAKNLTPQTVTPAIAATPQAATPQAATPTVADTSVQRPVIAPTEIIDPTTVTNVAPAQAPNIASLPGVNFDPRLLGGGDFETLRQSLLAPTQQLLETERQRAIDQTQEGLAQRGIFSSPVSQESERRVNEQYSQATQRAADTATSQALTAETQQNNVLNQILGSLAGTEFTGGVTQNVAQGGLDRDTALANLDAALQSALTQAGITSGERTTQAQLGTETNLANLGADVQTNLAQGDIDANRALNDALIAAGINTSNLGAATDIATANLGVAADINDANANRSQAARLYNADSILGADKFNILQQLGLDEAEFNRFATLFATLFAPAGSGGTTVSTNGGILASILSGSGGGIGQGIAAYAAA